MNDKRNEARRALAEEWERAVECVQEDIHADAELDRERMNDAAGLHIQSGAQAGGWTHTTSCHDACVID